jgi:hypothetical protein
MSKDSSNIPPNELHYGCFVVHTLILWNGLSAEQDTERVSCPIDTANPTESVGISGYISVVAHFNIPVTSSACHTFLNALELHLGCWSDTQQSG